MGPAKAPPGIQFQSTFSGDSEDEDIKDFLKKLTTFIGLYGQAPDSLNELLPFYLTGTAEQIWPYIKKQRWPESRKALFDRFSNGLDDIDSWEQKLERLNAEPFDGDMYDLVDFLNKHETLTQRVHGQAWGTKGDFRAILRTLPPAMLTDVYSTLGVSARAPLQWSYNIGVGELRHYIALARDREALRKISLHRTIMPTQPTRAFPHRDQAR
jgi:hypothetical protein